MNRFGIRAPGSGVRDPASGIRTSSAVRSPIPGRVALVNNASSSEAARQIAAHPLLAEANDVANGAPGIGLAPVMVTRHLGAILTLT
jgi:hypothetical protein